MSLFVRATSIERDCPILVNLDLVVEICPIADGSVLFFVNTDAVPLKVPGSGPIPKIYDIGRTGIKVKESFEQFGQFAMETISAKAMAEKIDKIDKATKTDKLDIPKL